MWSLKMFMVRFEKVVLVVQEISLHAFKFCSIQLKKYCINVIEISITSSSNAQSEIKPN